MALNRNNCELCNIRDEDTNDLVADIATATGFFDQSHLTRTFVRERGITPGECRRKHRQA